MLLAAWRDSSWLELIAGMIQQAGIVVLDLGVIEEQRIAMESGSPAGAGATEEPEPGACGLSRRGLRGELSICPDVRIASCLHLTTYHVSFLFEAMPAVALVRQVQTRGKVRGAASGECHIWRPRTALGSRTMPRQGIGG